MDHLVTRYHGKLLDFAYRHFRDRDAAADIAQRTLIRAYECAGSYRAAASFKTWLYTIALNLVRDEGRRRKAKRETLSSELRASDEGEDLLDRLRRDGLAEQWALDRVLAESVWDLLDELPESQKTAIILRFRHGLDHEEIASVMGSPPGTVRSWVHHGLKKLRGTLKPMRCEV